MVPNIKTSIVVTTYNWPEALRLSLNCIARQSVKPHEVIVADDGSKDETRQVIDAFRAESGLRVRHVWHEDRGFRRSAILNKALRLIDPDNYVIMIDGDVLLHKHFIKDHIRLAEPGYYVFGRRAILSKHTSKKAFQRDNYRPHLWTPGISHRGNMLYLPQLTSVTIRYKRSRLYGYGCNLAAWQSDILKINGFDENYEGWGCEDNDFICRLRNLGLTSKAAKFQGIIYHLWHEQRPLNNKNSGYYKQALEHNAVRCEMGISQHH